MEAKDRVYQALCRMAKSDCQITAAALAEELNLSRQVVSHYLNRLLEEGCVEKTLTRPVCWNIRKQQRENVQGSVSEERKEIEEVLPEVRREDVFDAMIGADGSQKNVIEMQSGGVISAGRTADIDYRRKWSRKKLSGKTDPSICNFQSRYQGKCSVGSAELCRLCEQSRTIVGSTFRVQKGKLYRSGYR